jgi:iron complex outermembrane receptor protein
MVRSVLPSAFCVVLVLTAAGPLARAEVRDSKKSPTPLETVVVVADRRAPRPTVTDTTPAREGRLDTIPDLFRGLPGVLAEPAFGGFDHPRLAIRGSGLQRGTMPAGRGVELWLDGLPMTYADGSYDFVEWIDPLIFESVSLWRGGRGADVGATALGGVIDFRGLSPRGDGALFRGETGSFRTRRAQAVGELAGAGLGLVGTATRHELGGFREHSVQRATRGYAQALLDAGDWTVRASVLASDSALEPPGPQTLADIRAGRRMAQPGNVRGDWRRDSERARLALGADGRIRAVPWSLDVAWMETDTVFRRRDEIDERNRDLALALRVGSSVEAGTRGGPGLAIVHQRGRRDAALFLNGGGTIPTFTGTRGLRWADNRFDAERLTVLARHGLEIASATSLDLTLGWNRHARTIRDRFPTRPARPPAEYDRVDTGLSGLALLTVRPRSDLAAFVALSRVVEPPTFDVLFLNLPGTGSGAALIDGPNPRRPVVADLDPQRMTTFEVGLRGAFGPATIDATVYRAWLRREIVSTSDFVSQTVTSVGNADRTTRFGVELAASVELGSGLLLPDDHWRLRGAWARTDARFDGDPAFGGNRLPIIARDVIDAGLEWSSGTGWFGGPLVRRVPRGGFVDYANTTRAPGYTTLGARLGWRGDRLTLFVEGRNLGDVRHVATVITAQNNLGGADFPTFTPGEGRAATVGIELAL